MLLEKGGGLVLEILQDHVQEKADKHREKDLVELCLDLIQTQINEVL